MINRFLKYIIKIIIKCFVKLALYIYLIKCKFLIILYGTNSVGMILERVPEVYIVPIMKKYGLQIGEGSRILPGIIFNSLSGKMPFKNLIIGEYVHIGRGVLFDLTDKIILNDHCALGAGCQVWTHVGNYTYDFSDYSEKVGMVNIGKGVLCWSRVILSPGVSIGDYSRVAAGSVVVRNIDTKQFHGGVPAKLINTRSI